MTYKTILLASDGSELAKSAARHAGELAKLTGASLSVVTVSSSQPAFAAAEIGWSLPVDVYERIREADAAAAVQIFEQTQAASGVKLKEKVHLEDVSPADGILEAAQKLGADLIVMGSHGYSGLNRLLLGSQAAKVLSHSPIPVLIIK